MSPPRWVPRPKTTRCWLNSLVWVYSEAGHGTVFKAYLPQTAPASDAPGLPTDTTEPVGWETVLLVEDEDLVRVLAREVPYRQV